MLLVMALGSSRTTWAAPAGAAAQLTYFVGTWRCEAVGDPHASQLLTVAGDANLCWLRVDRQALPRRAVCAQALWGHDPVAGRFVQFAGQSGGAFRQLQSLGWQGDVWAWQGTQQPPDAAVQTVRQRLLRQGSRQFTETSEILRNNRWERVDPVRLCRRLKDVADVEVKAQRGSIRRPSHVSPN